VRISLRVIEEPEALLAVEELQRQVWGGSETEVVPKHMLVAAIHNGGLAVGAYNEDSGEDPHLVGFVFGFPGLYATPDGPRLKHCSHMLGVHPAYRDQGIGFLLKRAQWQLVRNQGLDRITWTFDPLLSRNAYLNISRLGAVCNTYLRAVYGVMRDGINTGLPSDRLQVDWWVNSQRVNLRLSRRARLSLDLAHYLAAGAQVINATQVGEDGLPRPGSEIDAGDLQYLRADGPSAILLLEIPADFPGLKTARPELALHWRYHIRQAFEELFSLGYLVTDFIHLPGLQTRSFYVLTHGESTL